MGCVECMFTTEEIVRNNYEAIMVVFIIINLLVGLFLTLPTLVFMVIFGIKKKAYVLFFSLCISVVFSFLTLVDSNAIIHDIDDWHRRCAEYVEQQGGCGG